MSDEKTPLEKILDECPIAPEEITSWLQQPVTMVFMARIRAEQKLCDELVHYQLKPKTQIDRVSGIIHVVNNINEAIAADGGREACQTILQIPQDIIDELNERKADEDTKNAG